MSDGARAAGLTGQPAQAAGNPPFTEDADDTPFTFRSLAAHILRNKAVFGPLAAASFFVNLLGYLYPLAFLIIIDKVISNRGDATLDVLILALFFFLVLEAILRGARHRALRRTARHMDRSLLSRLIHHALELPSSFHLHVAPVEILSRIEEMHHLRRFLTNAVVFIAVDLVFVALFLGLMLNFSLTLSLIILACVPFYLAPAFLVMPTVEKWSRRNRGSRRQSNEAVLDTFDGIETVKGMHAEQAQGAFLTERVDDAVSSDEDFRSLRESMTQYNQFVNRFATAGLLWWGASMVLDGQLTLGQLVAINILNMRFSQPMMRLCLFAYDFSRLRVQVQEVGAVLNEPPERQGGHLVQLPQLKGSIHIEAVRFRYPGGHGNALDGVTLEIEPGQTLGIVGPSGSGKSTIGRLIQRLYLATEGRVLLDGTDAAQLDPGWLRSHIGMAEQDPRIFRRSIAENIALRPTENCMAEVTAAAKAACAHEFIMRTPKGYATRMGSRGTFLSGGERQRIALARALFHSSRVLILDEATSSVDQDDELRIQDNIRRLLHQRTVIIIAHRLSALRYADRIIALSQGQVVEEGTPEELARGSGYFANLVGQQTGLLRDLATLGSGAGHVQSVAGKPVREARGG